MTEHHVIMVGCGGIAYQARSLFNAWLMEQRTKGHNLMVHLVDPDTLEEKNKVRQWCEYAEGPKVDLMDLSIPVGIDTYTYVSKWHQACPQIEQALEETQEGDPIRVTVFAYPDNNECRFEIEKDMQRWFEDFKKDIEIVGVTGGNGDKEANAFGFLIREDGTANGWGAIIQRDSPVVDPTIPSCGQGNAQTPIANAMAAVMSFQLLDYLERDYCTGDRWIGMYWSAERMKMFSQEVPSGFAN